MSGGNVRKSHPQASQYGISSFVTVRPWRDCLAIAKSIIPIRPFCDARNKLFPNILARALEIPAIVPHGRRIRDHLGLTVSSLQNPIAVDTRWPMVAS